MRNSFFLTFFILIFAFLNQSKAHDHIVHCDPHQDFDSLDSLDHFANQLAKKVEWNSADISNVKNRSCKKSLPTPEEVSAEVDRLAAKGAKVSDKVNGVNFSEESPEMVQAFLELTSEIDFYGKQVNPKNIQKEFSINPECSKAKCAIEKIFGKELGDKMLYMKLKYGFNTSERSFKDSSRLKIDEMNSLISAVEAFPSSRFPLDKNQRLTMYSRGRTLSTHDDSTYAYAAIAFYDLWSNQAPEKREYIAFHELAHNIGGELKLDSNPAWLKLSGWVEKDGKWTASNKDAIPSRYGATNPDEDFAETVSAYRYNPQLLKEISPDKYRFMKEVVFDGLEYLETSQCSPENSFQSKLASKVLSENKAKENPIELISSCGEQVKKYILAKPGSKDILNSCLTKAHMASAMSEEIGSLGLKYPDLLKSNFAKHSPNVDMRATDNIPFSETKNLIRKTIANEMAEFDKRNDFNYVLQKGKNVCNATWDQYGYQAIFEKNVKLRDSINVYASKDEFNKFLNGLCNKIHKGKADPKPITTTEVEQALDLP